MSDLQRLANWRSHASCLFGELGVRYLTCLAGVDLSLPDMLTASRLHTVTERAEESVSCLTGAVLQEGDLQRGQRAQGAPARPASPPARGSTRALSAPPGSPSS